MARFAPNETSPVFLTEIGFSLSPTELLWEIVTGIFRISDARQPRNEWMRRSS